MKLAKYCLFGLATAGLAFTMGASAGTVVRETAQGDLLVIDYRGKPPHKRRLISQDDTQAWERYAAQLDTVRVATRSVARSGPRGKNLPAQVARIEQVPASEVTRFARFEETDSAAGKRLWRGAPGKGRPVSGR